MGATHDAHDDGRGAVARAGEEGLCLTCGASVPLPEGDLVGRRLTGGPPNPKALARPAARSRRAGSRAGGSGGRRGGARSSGSASRAASGSRRTRS